ncbi:hypothetical protein KC331_g19 [Hortaea werneckii]|nr:hypothetical protein KC331_g19 [Hortaea werneckii]
MRLGWKDDSPTAFVSLLTIKSDAFDCSSNHRTSVGARLEGSCFVWSSPSCETQLIVLAPFDFHFSSQLSASTTNNQQLLLDTRTTIHYSLSQPTTHSKRIQLSTTPYHNQ